LSDYHNWGAESLSYFIINYYPFRNFSVGAIAQYLDASSASTLVRYI